MTRSRSLNSEAILEAVDTRVDLSGALYNSCRGCVRPLYAESPQIEDNAQLPRTRYVSLSSYAVAVFVKHSPRC